MSVIHKAMVVLEICHKANKLAEELRKNISKDIVTKVKPEGTIHNEFEEISYEEEFLGFGMEIEESDCKISFDLQEEDIQKYSSSKEFLTKMKLEETIQNEVKKLSNDEEFLGLGIKVEEDECKISLNIKEEEIQNYSECKNIITKVKLEGTFQNEFEEISYEEEFLGFGMENEESDCKISFDLQEEEIQKYSSSKEFLTKMKLETIQNEVQKLSYDEEFLGFGMKVEEDECEISLNIKEEEIQNYSEYKEFLMKMKPEVTIQNKVKEINYEEEFSDFDVKVEEDESKTSLNIKEEEIQNSSGCKDFLMKIKPEIIIQNEVIEINYEKKCPDFDVKVDEDEFKISLNIKEEEIKNSSGCKDFLMKMKPEVTIQNEVKEINYEEEFSDFDVKVEEEEFKISHNIKEKEIQNSSGCKDFLMKMKPEIIIQNEVIEINYEKKFSDFDVKVDEDEFKILLNIKEEEIKNSSGCKDFLMELKPEVTIQNEVKEVNYEEEFADFNVKVEEDDFKIALNIKEEIQNSSECKRDHTHHGSLCEKLTENINEQKCQAEKLYKRNYNCISKCSNTSFKKSCHLLNMSSPSGEQPIKCLICSYSVSHKSDLVKHMRTHTGLKLFKCSSCSYSASKKSHLDSHLKTHTRLKPFKCSNCSYSASRKSHLIGHMRTHTDLKPFKCSNCSYSASQKSHLLSHMRTHPSLKPFKCSKCSYSSSEKPNLERHMRTHTGEKPFKCSRCSYSASQKCHLVSHMRTHTGLKPFKCSSCSYSSSEKRNLVSHMRTHTGLKPFKCSSCSYSTSHRSDLVKHMRTHTGLRPFKCSSCSYSASRKSHLVSHLRTHTGEKPFKCSNCSYRASRKSHLISHMRTHTRENPFKCSSCSYRTSRKRHLKSHMRTHN